MKRRLLAMGLALLLVLAMVPTVWATPTDEGAQLGNGPSDTTGSSTLDMAPPAGGAGGDAVESEPENVLYIVDDEGTDEYDNLSDAMGAAKESVKLVKDEEIATEISVKDRTIILDLNGCTLTNTADPQRGPDDDNWVAVFRVGDGGNLTIQDNGTGGAGAIVGQSGEGNGAAVIKVVEGGTLTLEGGKITGNTTTGQGGGIFVSNGTLTVKDGAVITDNTAAEGGGIYAKGSSTVYIEGGTISGNKTTSDEMLGPDNAQSPAGGGGVAIVGDAKLVMSGGTITDNYSAGAGGGIGIRRDVDQNNKRFGSPQFTMTGGSVTNNTAEKAEGGGIRIEGKGTINPEDGNITITGNKSLSTRDLGGGGIFVVNDGKTTIQNAVITNNTAGGLGGGIAACVHGEIAAFSTHGAAIYENTAIGENFTDGGNADNKAVVEGDLDKKFTASQANDFFSSGVRDDNDKGASLVVDRMPGGGSHNWSGVDGGTSVTIPAGSYHSTEKYLVLTADPTQEDIDRANDSLSGGKVLISNNCARNHGGGIAVNGFLVFGETEEYHKLSVEAGLDVTKNLLQVNTVTEDQTSITKDLDGYVFELLDSSKYVIAEAVSDAGGKAHLDIPADAFNTTDTKYTFYLREKDTGVDGVTYDPDQYTVTVQVEPDNGKTITIGDGVENALNGSKITVTVYTYTVTNITITDAEGNVVEKDNVTFTNKVYYTPAAAGVTLFGEKRISGENAPDNTVFTFNLVDSTGQTIDTKTVTGAGTFTFDTLIYDEVGTHTYTVTEVCGNETGWTYDRTVYTVTVDVEANANGDLTVSDEYSVGEKPCKEIVFWNDYEEPDEPDDNPPDNPPDEPDDNPPDNPPEEPDEPDEPDEPEEPDEPDEPEEPDTPDEPDEPTTDIPDDPTPEGDVPGEPDVPTTDIPDDPTPEGDVPDEPGLPQTGQQWWPVGLLALTGAGLVLAGLFKTKYRGKHEA